MVRHDTNETKRYRVAYYGTQKLAMVTGYKENGGSRLQDRHRQWRWSYTTAMAMRRGKKGGKGEKARGGRATTMIRGGECRVVTCWAQPQLGLGFHKEKEGMFQKSMEILAKIGDLSSSLCLEYLLGLWAFVFRNYV